MLRAGIANPRRVLSAIPPEEESRMLYMRKVLPWILVLWPVASVDLWYAWVHREDFGQWEANPAARLIYWVAGIGGIVVTKGAACTLATLVGLRSGSRVLFASAVLLGAVVIVALWRAQT
jgi:hypothetical protein